MAPSIEGHDEQVLLELLNSTPVTESGQLDLLGSDDETSAWAHERGGVGSSTEAAHLRRVRDRLQAVVRAEAPAASLTLLLKGVRLRPELRDNGFGWRLDVEEDRRLPAQVLLSWGRLRAEMPGRLRACGNDECRLFLLDHSRANTARWCSMKVCGNRMKARRHYQRGQTARD